MNETNRERDMLADIQDDIDLSFSGFSAEVAVVVTWFRPVVLGIFTDIDDIVNKT